MTNRLAVILVICIATLCVPFLTRAGSFSEPTSRGTSEPPSLDFTMIQVGKRYCCGNQLMLDVKLTFRNVGTERLLLARDKVISRIFVSRSPEEMRANSYVSSASNMFSLGENKIDLATPDTSIFVALDPGELYESEKMAIGPFGLSVVFDERGANRGLVPGEYYLQVEAITFPFLMDEKKVDELREQWKSHGYLYTESLKSSPMRFTVDEHPVF